MQNQQPENYTILYTNNDPVGKENDESKSIQNI